MVVLVGFQHIIKLQFNVGILLAVLASFFYAIYIMLTKGILQKISTLTFMFYNMLAASIFLLTISVFQNNNLFSFSINTWLCLFGMGLICQLTGWITINHSIRFLPSTKVAIALLGQTVLAGFWAILFLNERLELKEIIGSVIVLAGIAITFLKPKKGIV
jgi:drug/metabolite transporter (DMT)-like permease